MLSQKHRAYAQEFLEYFVKAGGNLYGKEFLVYNVHFMVHLSADVDEHGNLDKCSAFPFENYMQHLKKKPLRSGNKSLVQIAKGLSEEEKIELVHQLEQPTIRTQKPDCLHSRLFILL